MLKSKEQLILENKIRQLFIYYKDKFNLNSKIIPST